MPRGRPKGAKNKVKLDSVKAPRKKSKDADIDTQGENDVNNETDSLLILMEYENFRLIYRSMNLEIQEQVKIDPTKGKAKNIVRDEDDDLLRWKSKGYYGSNLSHALYAFGRDLVCSGHSQGEAKVNRMISVLEDFEAFTKNYQFDRVTKTITITKPHP